MKPVLQTQASECGLACLVMVSNHYGRGSSLHESRQRFGPSLRGMNLAGMIRIAGKLGLQARPLRLELDDLPKLKLPCVLHWDLNHFVVLTRVGRSGVTLIDPTSGERRLSLAEASTRFTGVALELQPGPSFEKRPEPSAIGLRQLTGRISGLWRSLTRILLLSVALQVFVLLAPFYMQWVVDQALVSADGDLLVILGLGFGLSLILQTGIGLLRGWSVAYLSSGLSVQWTGNVFAHALKLPMSFFEKRHLGDLVSRMGAVQAIQKTLTTSFVESIIDGLMTIATLSMMLLYSARLALATLAAVALYLGLRAFAFRPLRAATEQQLIAAARQQTHLLESLRGMQSVKVAGCEAIRHANYQNLVVDTVGFDLRLSRLGIGFSAASQAIFGIERVAVIWLGASLVLNSEFSVGMLIAYLAYKDQFATRVSSLIDKWVEFRMLRLHGERLADIVLTQPEPSSVHGMDAASPASMRLEVKDLGFRYAEGEPWVLKDCSFTLEPGESVAIVGPSGCGKTTLVKLLLGLLPADEGVVSLGGHDIRRLGLQNYLALVGTVMQDDQLFAGSIAENIALGDPEIDFLRVEEAASAAAVHGEIASMPMGFHTLVGDMGTVLSGGQKQRVLLARALYRRPRLLVLDEATSQLDVERERLVNDAVRRLEVSKLIIAHRPETIASADRVLVMASGRIVQELRPKQQGQALHAVDV